MYSAAFRPPKRGRAISVSYLKAPNAVTPEATDELRARVSEMLLDIERGGIDAVRRYSRELDDWDPEELRGVRRARSPRAASQLDDELKEHIAFAQDQVRELRRGAARRR